MKKNVYLVLLVVSALALIRQIPFFTAGVRLHGFAGSNYGAVLIPLALLVLFAGLLRKEKRMDHTSA